MASDNVGPEIDAQLAKIVSDFVTTRLPDDKLKEKLTACLAPKNCAGIVSPRVNPEIWEKLSTQTKSRINIAVVIMISVDEMLLILKILSSDPKAGIHLESGFASMSRPPVKRHTIFCYACPSPALLSTACAIVINKN